LKINEEIKHAAIISFIKSISQISLKVFN